MTTKTHYLAGSDDLYIGPIECSPNPEEPGKWLVPFGAYVDVPPATAEREIAKRSADKTKWDVVPDWRGYTYFLADRSQHEITEVEVEPPSGALEQDPGPSLDEVKVSQVAVITAACAADIVGGFTSTALGESFTYPSSPTDQANLNAAASASRQPGLGESWVTYFYCADAAGVWARRPHSAAEIQQVGMDGYNAIMSKLLRKDSLEVQINSLKTIAKVKAVKW